jgi:TPP-dependent 2-oxoacid decarboxylase
MDMGKMTEKPPHPPPVFVCLCSIGWSVGATLGYSLAAAAAGKRLLSFIGDGSFQVPTYLL